MTGYRLVAAWAVWAGADEQPWTQAIPQAASLWSVDGPMRLSTVTEIRIMNSTNAAMATGRVLHHAGGPEPLAERHLEVGHAPVEAGQRGGELGIGKMKRPLDLSEQALLTASQAHALTSGVMLGWRQRGPAHDDMG